MDPSFSITFPDVGASVVADPRKMVCKTCKICKTSEAQPGLPQTTKVDIFTIIKRETEMERSLRNRKSLKDKLHT